MLGGEDAVIRIGVPPGALRVEVHARGGREASAEITLASGADAELSLELE